ncbi:MAG TPA: toll/interleukin-1 receptor domain-containing protein [Candidatus Methanoperedens sp.]
MIKTIQLMKNPTCFISYSWDNDEHKDWVRGLATELMHNGIETKLDQWDCHLGMDLTNYMETCVRESDFVLLICTPNYCRKANNGHGGVGYEKNIVTGEIFEGIASPKKFVPVLRKGSPIDSLPSYLKSRMFIDFRNDNTFDLNIKQLIRHLHNSPKYIRPDLGEKPNLSEEVKKQKIESVSISKRPQLAIYKQGYNFAIKNMGKLPFYAEEFAVSWIDKFSNKDFEDFKEAYNFAIKDMGKLPFYAEEFAFAQCK